MTVQLREALRSDGDRFHNYETLEVRVDDQVVGMIQCRGPCRDFEGRFVPGHKHREWISFVGPDTDKAMNLAGVRDKEAAVEAVLEEVRKAQP